jgi:hypothetical protein
MVNSIEQGGGPEGLSENLTEEAQEILGAASALSPEDGRNKETKEFVTRMGEVMQGAERTEEIDLDEDEGVTILQVTGNVKPRFLVFRTDEDGYNYSGGVVVGISTGEYTPVFLSDTNIEDPRITLREYGDTRIPGPPIRGSKIKKGTTHISITGREGFPIDAKVQEIWHMSSEEN